MGQTQLLFAGIYQNIDNAWIVPTTVLMGAGTGVVATTGCFFSGPGGCYISELYYIARDLTFTDPANDVRIGYRIRYSSDGGVSLTTVTTVLADADCPVIWDNGTNDFGDFVLDVPLKAFDFVNAGRPQPILIPANVHVIVEVAPVDNGSVYDVSTAEIDDLDVLVYGYYKS